jgi:hypothetical protein
MPGRTVQRIEFGRVGRRVIEANFDGGDQAAGGARLRQAWPAVRLVVRGDSGFWRQRRLRYCERAGVGYLIGLARHARLEARVASAERMLAEDYGRTGAKQRWIDEFADAADSWSRERRVIPRLEFGAQGTNPRFVVTNLEAEAPDLHERPYCARGEAENRIKDVQLDLFGTRASCRRFAANQLRLLLAALAYTLMQRLREIGQKATELEPATARGVPARCPRTGPLKLAECCPRHANKHRGSGASAPAIHPTPRNTVPARAKPASHRPTSRTDPPARKLRSLVKSAGSLRRSVKPFTASTSTLQVVWTAGNP